MNSTTSTRQQISQLINELTDEVLPELANFLEYLRFKSNQLTVKKASEENNFLMAIAGLGESDETDLSERDEEILAQEIDSYLNERAKTGNQAKYQAILAKVPDRKPKSYDQLPTEKV